MLIKDILLQLFFIITPIFLFQSIWSQQSHLGEKARDKYLIALHSSISILLCMTFPMQVSPGYIYDLRSIAILIAILYGGYGPGLVACAVMLLYRFYLGGDGMISTLLAVPFYVVVPFLIVKDWYGYSRRKKFVMFLCVGMIRHLVSAVALVFTVFNETGSMSAAVAELLQQIPSGVIATIAMLIVIMLAEYIRENTYMRNQMIQSERLTLISELAASVAHEVRNPITVVRGFVQLFRENANAKNQEYIRLILTELDRAEFIISDYLNLAKPAPEVREIQDVGVMVEEVALFMSAYGLMNGVQISFETERNLNVRANTVRLKQVFINIMKNGIEAMPKGGSLQVTASLLADKAVIKIRDTGQGMTKQQIKQIGEAFYSTKSNGTGLGLLISYRIIHSLAGTVSIESQHGKGTLVTVRLPIAQ